MILSEKELFIEGGGSAGGSGTNHGRDKKWQNRGKTHQRGEEQCGGKKTGAIAHGNLGRRMLGGNLVSND